MLSRWAWLSGCLLVACEPNAPRPSSSPPQGSEVTPTTTAQTPAPSKPETAPAPANVDAAPTSAEITEDVHRANAFTFKMLGRIKKPTENAMLSATSLRLALGTTFIGARGTTASEMATALSFRDDAALTARLARAELSEWESARGKADLSIASRVWIDDDITVFPEFTKLAESGFGTAPASTDYAKPEDARRSINAWVAQNTNNRITDLLPPGSIDPSTRLVVTNAVWFKGRWELPFQKNATKDEPFKIDARKNVTAPSMHATDTYRVAVMSGLKVLELRYAESNLAMLVALPDESSSLAKLEASLGETTIDDWNAALATARVKVTLPRFTFRYGGSMNTPLRDLGMKVAFTDKADFTGIAELRGGLFIGNVFHQTWIAVDEIGTEATAATGVTMRTTSLITGPVVDFRADHPFLFVIEDTKQQRALFAGRVANPTL